MSSLIQLDKAHGRQGVLGRTGKLDRNAGGDNAFEFHAEFRLSARCGGRLPRRGPRFDIAAALRQQICG